MPAGIHPVGRLVQNEQPGAPQHGRGQAEPLAHPEGVAADLLARRSGQAHRLDRLVNEAVRVTAVESGQDGQVLPPGQVGIEPRGLDEPAHPVQPAGPGLGPGAPEKPQGSLVRQDQAEESGEQRGLASAVGTEQPVHDARTDEQVYLVEGGCLAEPLRHPAGLDC